MNWKIISIFILVCLIFIGCSSQKESPAGPVTNLVLMNPDIGFLKSFHKMMQMGIIDIANLELTAVYYNKSDENISEINNFAHGYRSLAIHVRAFEGDLSPDNLFGQNSCSNFFSDIFKNSDGIIFLGGADFSPEIYSQKTNLLTIVSNPERSFFEISFLFHLLGGNQDEKFAPLLDENRDFVIYGFCLGMQTMNVATGGTMYQDIPSEIYNITYVEDLLNLDQNLLHRNYWRHLSRDPDLRSGNFHRINLLADKFFITQLDIAESFQPLVRSSHHQALARIGKDFEVTATSLDGKVVEALAHTRYKNVIGVQFHPEYLSLYDPQYPGGKYAPQDTALITRYQLLKDNGSLDFHYTFWQHFSGLFN